jgi:ubiquinone/menaquinone biosynthesis C-methylase UbiE
VWYRRLIKIAKLKKGKRIIDCAVGDGRGIAPIKLLKPRQLVCVDIANKWVQRCQMNHSDVTAICGDIRNLPFKNSFDYFFCCETLEHLHPKYNEQAVQSILRSIVKGGSLLVSVPGNKKFCYYSMYHKQFLKKAMIKKFFSKHFKSCKEATVTKNPIYPNKTTNIFVFEKKL